MILPLALSLLVSGAHAEDTTKIVRTVASREVVVTGSRTPVERAKLGRAVDVITASEIAKLPARSVVDLLQYVPGVDLRQRGPLGVQADVSIRGGTFEQTGVLVDGMRMNDVQTGHHALNVPVNVQDVERIEIVKGGASRLFGSGAMDGAINIISKRYDSAVVHATLVGGDFGYGGANLSGAVVTGDIAHQVSLAKQHSEGYRQSTDFDMDMASYSASYAVDATRIRVYGGAVNKAFGANGFYAAAFPNQWEHTVTWTAGANVTTPLSEYLELQVQAMYRINADEFLLKRDTPTFYRNTHQTNQLTSMAQLNYTSSLGVSSIALEAGSDAIVSSNLKDHDRVRGGVALEHSANVGDLFVTAGGAVQGYSDRVPAFTGGVDLSYPLMDDVRVFGTVNRSMRVPTYTELYYRAGNSIGDSTLRPETAVTMEAGANIFVADSQNVRISGYHRNASDLIDYAPVAGSLPPMLKASNVNSVKITGVELSSTWNFRSAGIVRSLHLGGMAQDVTSSIAKPTLYVSDNLNYQAMARVVLDLPLEITASVALRAFQRVTNPTVKSVLDARVNVPVIRNIMFFMEASNIYNTNYIETNSVVMPPRWFRAGISM